MTLDYRKLLKRYMRCVIDAEGVAFIPPDGDEGAEELRRILEEIQQEA